MCGSREISLVPSLHRASTDALIYNHSEKFQNSNVYCYIHATFRKGLVKTKKTPLTRRIHGLVVAALSSPSTQSVACSGSFFSLLVEPTVLFRFSLSCYTAMFYFVGCSNP